MNKRAFSSAALFAIYSLHGTQAFAQSAEALAAETNGDIIVTAQKRSESVNTVPMSITAVSGKELAARGVSDISNLDKVAPGFVFQKTSFGVPVFGIRGVSFYDRSLFSTPSVSVYNDEVPLPFSSMTRGVTLDLERVEVLKGPQGTLFGQNSTGGALNFIAAKPTRDLQAGFGVDVGRFNAVNASAFVSGPLTSNLRARLAVRNEYQGDWQRSYTRDDTLGEKRFYAGRLLLDWDPNTRLRFSVNLNGWKDRSDSQAAQFIGFYPNTPAPRGFAPALAALSVYPIAPADNRAADWTPGIDLGRNSSFWQASLRGEFDVTSDIRFTSISAYSRFKATYGVDPDGTSYPGLYYTSQGNARVFSQEARLAGDSGPVSWLIGGNYQEEHAAEVQNANTRSTNSVSAGFSLQYSSRNNEQNVKTWAGFGSIDYKVTDTLKFQVSGRYTTQTRTFSGCQRDVDGNFSNFVSFLASTRGVVFTVPQGSCVTLDDATFLPVLPEVDARVKSDNFSWRVGPTWQLNRDMLLYANVSRGYKFGSFPSLGAIFRSQLTPVTPESLTAYEAGFKTALFDHAIQLNGAIFHYDYRDKQVLGTFPSLLGPLAALVNIPESRINGAELQLTIRPIGGLRVDSGITYIDSKVLGSFVTPDPLGRAVDIGGQPFPNTPKWLGNADIQYDFPLVDGIGGFVGSAIQYRSATNGGIGQNPTFAINGYTLLDLRIGIKAGDDRWQLQLWGRNVTNKYYWVESSFVQDAAYRYTGAPATYGVSFSYRY